MKSIPNTSRAGRNGVATLCIVLISSIALIVSEPARSRPKKSSETWASNNDFGGAGLFQMRTARSNPDGNLEVGYSFVQPYKRYYLTVQALPWLEGTFRYTEIRNRLFSAGGLDVAGGQSFKDRGADLTFRLLPESRYLPSVSLTLQDGLGTGQFSGEYLAASKTYYDFFLTAGLAWGYAASGSTIDNPLAKFIPTFASRSGGGGQGGRFEIGKYLSGPKVAPYFGVEYRTPIDGLALKWELDPNDYQSERLGNTFLKSSDYNYGFTYRPFSWLEASYAQQRGNLRTFRLAVRSNLHDEGMPKFDPLPPELLPRDQVDKAIRTQLSELEDEGFLPKGDSALFYEAPISPPQRSESTIALNDDVSPVEMSQLRDNESDLKELAAQFRIEGIDVVDIEVRVGSVFVTVTRPSGKVHRQELYGRLAELVVTILPVDVEEVVFSYENSADKMERIASFERGEIENSAIIGRLFDELAVVGVTLNGITLDHQRAELDIAGPGAESASEFDLSKVSKLIFETMPMPLDIVSLKIVTANIGSEIYEFSRQDVARNLQVTDLFEGVEKFGIVIDTVNESRGFTTLAVKDKFLGRRGNYASAAVFVSRVINVSVDRIEFEDALSGEKIRWAEVVSAATHDGEIDGASSGETIRIDDATSTYSEEQKKVLARRLFDALADSGFFADGIVLQARKITAYGTANYFRQFARMTGRTARVIANNIPKEFEEISIVTLSGGMEMNKITIYRKDLENAVRYAGSPEEIWGRGRVEEGKPGISLPDDAIYNWKRYPKFKWSISPLLRSHVGGPNQFILYQLWGSVGGNLSVWRGLDVAANVGLNIYNNFDKITLESDSVLPHVRSDIKDYLQQGSTNLVRLQANYMFSPAAEWYTRLSWGIFEEMYGGYGGEVLHRANSSRFAIGAELYKLKQRDFNQRFTYRDYKITTGHLSAYYQWPWYNILSVASVGRYLAGDVGATVSISRQFDSGVQVGIWATLTDVSAEQFGEGSFDKGFAISLPFDLFLSKSTTKSGSFAFRPLFRDGGQRAGAGPNLFDVTSASSKREIIHNWDRFMD